MITVADKFIFIFDCMLFKQTSERSNSEPSKPQKAKRVTKPREKKEQNSTPKKKGARKGNKKIISSDEDSDGGDISMEFSGGDSDEDFGKEDSSFENLAGDNWFC